MALRIAALVLRSISSSPWVGKGELIMIQKGSLAHRYQGKSLGLKMFPCSRISARLVQKRMKYPQAQCENARLAGAGRF